jgi:hypothetical protein
MPWLTGKIWLSSISRLHTVYHPSEIEFCKTPQTFAFESTASVDKFVEKSFSAGIRMSPDKALELFAQKLGNMLGN